MGSITQESSAAIAASSNKAINSDNKKLRCALLFVAGYGNRWARKGGAIVMTDERGEHTNWWATLPGALTAIAAVISAVTGLLVAVDKFGGPEEPHPMPPESEIVNLLQGQTGWIYVGTRIESNWKASGADGSEPALTLDLTGLPQRGSIYQLKNGVNLRENLPHQETAGQRPPMPNTKGAIKIGAKLKVDDVREIYIESPKRTWVWAHVTVL